MPNQPITGVSARSRPSPLSEKSPAFQGPLADSYKAAAALVVFALVPFLMLSAAVYPLAREIGRSLQISRLTLDVSFSVAYGGYAVGTVLAVQFASHKPQRRMLLFYVTTFL